MARTYKAVEVSAPGTLRVVEREVSEPGPGQVRIRVEACGVCHSDTGTVTGGYPGLGLPRVPGHEVVGRIDALGTGVSRWKIGQRVGVGFFGGEDGVCEPCRRGDMVNCQNPVIPGITMDGGYAEVIIAEARGIAAIPDETHSHRSRSSPLCGSYDIQRSSQCWPAGWRFSSCAGRGGTWASWYPVREAHGFSHSRHRPRRRQGEARQRPGCASLHRYCG
jgi:D-arabinose 1-dehydrogenase-like Zn-dependent alcohol dehydrogenase